MSIVEKPRLRPEALEQLNRDTQTHKSSLLGNLALFFISLCFTLALFEIVLRFAPIPVIQRLQTQQNAVSEIDEVHPKGLYTIEPKVGWTLTPSFNGRFEKDDFNILIESNTEGIRNEAVEAKTSEKYRILGLGDSFGFGWGVENKQGFFKVLENLINRQSSVLEEGAESAEVINAGIPGYGTYEAKQLMERLAPIYKPDVILLAMYEGNDYLNNAAAPRKRIIREGYLTDMTRERPQTLTWLLKHSLVASFLDVAIERVVKKTQFKGAIEKTKLQITEMQAYARENNIKLVVVLIPDQDIEFYNRPEYLRIYDKLVAGGDLFTARENLQAFMGENKIPFYQLSSRFENSVGSQQMRLKDTHFNEVGHRAAAIEIFEFIKEQDLLKS